MPGHVVKNAPYSADVITESTQTLADGSHIRQSNTARMYRDSEGRTRREQSLRGLGALTGGTSQAQVVFINDPVAGANYALNPGSKTANKSAWLARPGRQAAGGTGAEAVRQRPGFAGGRHHGGDANVATESLGTQAINGVQAQGTRITRTIPANSPLGNETALQIVIEQWYSPELQTVVLSKHTDPRSGETVTRLANVSRAEPAASLFQVPAEYKTVEGAFRRGPAASSTSQQ